MRLLRFSAFLFFIQKGKKKGRGEKKDEGKQCLYLCFHFSRLPVFISFPRFPSLALGISIKKGKE